MEGFAGELKTSFHVASHTTQKAAAAQTQDPWRPPQLLADTRRMTVAPAVAAGSAETPQGLLEAPAAGEVLGGAGMWPP